MSWPSVVRPSVVGASLAGPSDGHGWLSLCSAANQLLPASTSECHSSPGRRPAGGRSAPAPSAVEGPADEVSCVSEGKPPSWSVG